MDIFSDRCFILNKKFMSALGLWPYQPKRTRISRFTFFVSAVFSLVTPQIFATIEMRNDAEIVSLSLVSLATDVACLTKIFNARLNWARILNLAERMKSDWQSLLEDPEIDVLWDYAKTSRQFTIAYIVGMYFCLVLFLGQPSIPLVLQLFNLKNRSDYVRLPFPMYWYGIDNDAYWWHMFIHGYLVVPVLVTTIIATDTMYLVYVQHACSMFVVVGRKFTRMADQIRNSDEPVSQRQEDAEFQYVANCIKGHKAAIEIGGLIEDSYTWAFFSFIGINMVMISFTGYEMVMMLDSNPQEALRFAIFIVAQVQHLFFQSFFAERLKDHSETFRHQVYQAEWYRTSLKTQKLLGLVIMRTSVPCQLTAGKVIPMGLETFTTILKTSMSYFTLLRSMQ